MNDARVKEGMLCPVCRTDLMMTDRQGVEIDYCPRCRGVWLDRGELDKILERSAAPEPGLAPERRVEPVRYEQQRERYRGHDDDYKHRRHHRRKSWLGDMFDFD